MDKLTVARNGISFVWAGLIYRKILAGLILFQFISLIKRV